MIVEDPVVRQTYRLTRTGDVLRNELTAAPGAGVPEHFHPQIEERFEILEGDWLFEVDGQQRRLGPGDTATVAPGVKHRFENVGEGEARFVAEIEPALDMQGFFEESAALARDGAFAAPGRPRLRGLLPAAEFVDRYSATTVMTSPPRFVQRLTLTPLAWLARRVGRG